LAQIFGVSRLRIRAYRKLHGIAAVKVPTSTKFRWTKQEDRLLGTMSDRDLARQLGIPGHQVRHRRVQRGIPRFGRQGTIRWTKPRLAQLGQVSDQELAISEACVQEKRRELGRPKGPDHRGVWTDPRLLRHLGTMSDGQLARQLGLTPGAVRQKRVAMGIPAWNRTG
jgi:hypothetical protein